MNLDGLYSRTQVSFNPALPADQLTINGTGVFGPGLARVRQMLDRVRDMAGTGDQAAVTSTNNFPTGAGIASSASAFAALALAASSAAGLSLSETELSRLARTGSGSACRSIPSGFVEWYPGHDHRSSYAVSIAPPDHWDLVDCIAVVSQGHKPTGSTQGHALADTSPLQEGRLAGAPARLERCRRAILEKDFSELAQVVELDSDLMHAVMMTSTPPLMYWQPETLAVMQAVREWRASGLPALYTIDAGPNVHVISPADSAHQVSERLSAMPGVIKVLMAHPGSGARRIE